MTVNYCRITKSSPTLSFLIKLHTYDLSIYIYIEILKIKCEMQYQFLMDAKEIHRFSD